MAEQYQLKAQTRERTGSAEARRLRRAGYVPAVVYGKNEPSTHVKVLRTDITQALHTHLGENVIIALAIQNADKAQSKTVIIKEVQQDPVNGAIEHVDFDHISLTQKVKVGVPVVSKGDPIGVSQQGGVLERVLWELEIECLPTAIPDQITVDCTALEIGDAIHVKDLSLPQGLVVQHAQDAVVITVAPPAKEEVAETPEAAEGTEPEVIAKGKKEEEDEKGEAKSSPEQKTEEKK